MSKHFASARWEGNLPKGNGKFKLKAGAYEGAYSFTSRFEDNKQQSSPEELIGAAHAACFSMALSHILDQEGFTPKSVETQAEVTLDKSGDGFAITQILLKTQGKVEGIDKDKFLEIAEQAKTGCPVSKALSGTKIELKAELL